MKSSLKQLLEVIQCGVAGAFIFAGACLLVFCYYWVDVGTPLPSLFLIIIHKFSFNCIIALLLGTGFILGLAVGWRINFARRWVFILAAGFASVVFLVWVNHFLTPRISTPHTIKLADCTNSTTLIHIKTPSGHDHKLLLVVPGIETTPNAVVSCSYKFAGRIRIVHDGALVADWPIGSDKAWLTPSNFVLTGSQPYNTNVPHLSQFIQPHQNYDIEVSLTPPPPASSSIGLYWLQSRIDRKAD